MSKEIDPEKQRMFIDIDAIVEEGVLASMLAKRSQLIQKLISELKEVSDKNKTLEKDLERTKNELAKYEEMKKNWGKRITELERALKQAGVDQSEGEE